MFDCEVLLDHDGVNVDGDERGLIDTLRHELLLDLALDMYSPKQSILQPNIYQQRIVPIWLTIIWETDASVCGGRPLCTQRACRWEWTAARVASITPLPLLRHCLTCKRRLPATVHAAVCDHPPPLPSRTAARASSRRVAW